MSYFDFLAVFAIAISSYKTIENFNDLEEAYVCDLIITCLLIALFVCHMEGI